MGKTPGPTATWYLKVKNKSPQRRTGKKSDREKGKTREKETEDLVFEAAKENGKRTEEQEENGSDAGLWRPEEEKEKMGRRMSIVSFSFLINELALKP